MNNGLIKVLPKQQCFKIDDGEKSEVPLRLGRINSDLYKNRKVITTINGEKSFIPKVELFVETLTDDKCYILLNIIDYETDIAVKQFTIRSQPNNLSISEMKTIYDEIVTYLNSDSNEILNDLISYLKEKDDIIIEEYC